VGRGWARHAGAVGARVGFCTDTNVGNGRTLGVLSSARPRTGPPATRSPSLPSPRGAPARQKVRDASDRHRRARGAPPLPPPAASGGVAAAAAGAASPRRRRVAAAAAGRAPGRPPERRRGRRRRAVGGGGRGAARRRGALRARAPRPPPAPGGRRQRRGAAGRRAAAGAARPRVCLQTAWTYRGPVAGQTLMTRSKHSRSLACARAPWPLHGRPRCCEQPMAMWPRLAAMPAGVANSTGSHEGPCLSFESRPRTRSFSTIYCRVPPLFPPVVDSFVIKYFISDPVPYSRESSMVSRTYPCHAVAEQACSQSLSLPSCETPSSRIPMSTKLQEPSQTPSWCAYVACGSQYVVHLPLSRSAQECLACSNLRF